MTSPIHVTGTDFVTRFVQNFEATFAFYGTTLGLECSARYERLPGAEFETGKLTIKVLDAAAVGREFTPSGHPIALHVDDVEVAPRALEAEGVRSFGETMDSGVCHMAPFADPDENSLLLHNRYVRKEPA